MNILQMHHVHYTTFYPHHVTDTSQLPHRDVTMYLHEVPMYTCTPLGV